jgi:hypothetical protein
MTDRSGTGAAGDLAHAVEANGAEFFLALGRAGGGEERTEPQISG